MKTNCNKFNTNFIIAVLLLMALSCSSISPVVLDRPTTKQDSTKARLEQKLDSLPAPILKPEEKQDKDKIQGVLNTAPKPTPTQKNNGVEEKIDKMSDMMVDLFNKYVGERVGKDSIAKKNDSLHWEDIYKQREIDRLNTEKGEDQKTVEVIKTQIDTGVKVFKKFFIFFAIMGLVFALIYTVKRSIMKTKDKLTDKSDYE